MILIAALTALGGYAVCFALVAHWSSPQVGPAAKAVLALGWLLCLASLLAINLDIYQTVRLQEEAVPLVGLWRGFYWGSFFLGYIFFVVLGEQEPQDKTRPLQIWLRFYRRRLRLFAAGAAAALLGTGALVLKGALPLRSLDALPKLATNALGLLLIVLILGYSLPELPRKLRRRFDPAAELEHTLAKLALSRRALQGREYGLEHAVAVLTARLEREGDTAALGALRAATRPLPISWEAAGFADAEAGARGAGPVPQLCAVVDEAAEYQRQLRRIDGRTRHARRLMREVEGGGRGATRLFYLVLRPLLFRALFAATTLLSAALLLLIVANFVDAPRGFLLGFLRDCPLPLFFLALNVYLGYFAALVVFGVQRLKIQRFRGLAAGATGLPALLHFTRNVLRMAMPLIVNLLQVLQLEETQFSAVMGRPHFLPLMGDRLLRAFPALLLVLLLLRLTDAYARAMRLLGLDDAPFESAGDRAALVAATRQYVRQSPAAV